MCYAVVICKIQKTRQEMRIPERDVTYIVSVYVFTRTTHPLPEHFSKYRISATYNGRRLTKRALRILLLSTFCVSSINYYLVCSHVIHLMCAL